MCARLAAKLKMMFPDGGRYSDHLGRLRRVLKGTGVRAQIHKMIGGAVLKGDVVALVQVRLTRLPDGFRFVS
jgi:hypothetical protein